MIRELFIKVVKFRNAWTKQKNKLPKRLSLPKNILSFNNLCSPNNPKSHLKFNPNKFSLPSQGTLTQKEPSYVQLSRTFIIRKFRDLLSFTIGKLLFYFLFSPAKDFPWKIIIVSCAFSPKKAEPSLCGWVEQSDESSTENAGIFLVFHGGARPSPLVDRTPIYADFLLIPLWWCYVYLPSINYLFMCLPPEYLVAWSDVW